MAYNAAQIDFGQAGGAFLNTTNAYTPPTGKVIAYIEVVTAATTFNLLTPANDTGSNTYHLGTSVTAAATGNGANAVAISSENWAIGQKFYGRWSAITLTDGAIIMYFAQE